MKEIAESLDAYSFGLYPLRGEYAKRTLEVACENNITIYDASHISLEPSKHLHVHGGCKVRLTSK